VRAALAIVLAVLAAAPAQASPAGPCFTVRGRLYVANGTPAVRLWPIGSRRLLGVHGRDGDAAAADLVPPQAQRLLDADPASAAVMGQFRVCPLAPERPGRMRPVYIDRAWNLRAAKR
jgi:hypothetical protein